jgi:murein DD-endopeptidase MepM/ murein hydrolase activator NlpD
MNFIYSSKKIKKILSFLILNLILIGSIYFFPSIVIADEIDELEEKIKSQKERIEELDREIKEQRAKVTTTAAEANTIAGKIAELQATKNSLEKSISQTETKIEKSNLTIKKLAMEISDKEKDIANKNEILAQTLREMDRFENTSFVESVLGYEYLSSLWNHLKFLENFQNKIQDTVLELKNLNTKLISKKNEETEEKEELETNKKVLSGEREVTAATKSEQDKLYAFAKDKEVTYRSILEKKLAQKKEFEDALLNFESQLKTLIDPDSYPDANHGILDWPLDRIIVTQEFGGTQFAKNNPGIYGRPYHNGTDFGTPIGSKIKTVADGIIQATGNTDAYPGCYSWGKWILIKHNNGLSTLYAHLSSILVDSGDKVESGDIIALSGNTGVSTGPHLHLTLYASQGVEVHKFSEFKTGTTGCSATDARTPVAPLNAYLDPMEYLPKL